MSYHVISSVKVQVLGHTEPATVYTAINYKTMEVAKITVFGRGEASIEHEVGPQQKEAP